MKLGPPFSDSIKIDAGFKRESGVLKLIGDKISNRFGIAYASAVRNGTAFSIFQVNANRVSLAIRTILDSYRYSYEFSSPEYELSGTWISQNVVNLGQFVLAPDFYSYAINSRNMVIGKKGSGDNESTVVWLDAKAGLANDKPVDSQPNLVRLDWQRRYDEAPPVNLNAQMRGFNRSRVWQNTKWHAIADLTPAARSPSPTWRDISLSDQNDLGTLIGTAVNTADNQSYAILLVPAALQVDANRDGIINDSDVGQKTAPSQDKPFRFWSNDDDDGVDPVGQDIVPALRHDNSDNYISNNRDLEDFARLQLYIGGLQNSFAGASPAMKIGLKWKSVTGGTPSIRVFRTPTSQQGSDDYLKDEDAATALRATANAESSAVLVSGTTATLLPSNFLDGLSATQSKAWFVFEGVTEGKGQLVMTIHKADGTEIGEGPGVWFDLKKIRDLYARVRVTPEDADEKVALPLPYRNATTFDENQSDFQVEAFTPPANEAKQVMIFVHGSNESEAESRNRAETLYKRLWHQGYKGRLVFFHWDTLVGYMDGEYPVGQYNMNEYVALKYGPGLKKYQATLPQGYQVNVISHSLGNGVVGSALKSGMAVHNYIMMQAAFSAKAYNASLASAQRFQDAEVQRPTPDLAADRGYGGYFAGVQANVINMFNEVDFALATGTVVGFETNWEKNQIDYKPDDPPGIGQYYYGTYSQGSVSYTFDGTTRLVNDIHESLAFVARTRTKAVGALAGVGGAVSQEVNIGEGTPYNFSRSRSDHSAQFNRNIQQTHPFYQRVFDALGVTP